MNLRAGTYYITDLQFDTGATISSIRPTARSSFMFRTRSSCARPSSPSTVQRPDLLIGFLGTNSVFVEVQFDGAILSRFSPSTCATGPPAHRLFAGKGVELDAQADVGYRFPLAIIPAAAPPEVHLSQPRAAA